MIMFMPLPPVDSQRSQYLRTPQGKVAELRLELNSGGKKDKNFSAKKTALKKIVANMTMSNNDMVALFPDIVGCMHIPSLEIKKMYVCRAHASDEQPLTAPGASCIWSTMPG
jgi:AP-2 complex subunit beta-1